MKLSPEHDALAALCELLKEKGLLTAGEVIGKFEQRAATHLNNHAMDLHGNMRNLAQTLKRRLKAQEPPMNRDRAAIRA